MRKLPFVLRDARWSSSFLKAGMVALVVPCALARGQSTPVGRWQTLDDDDHKPTAVVEIREVNGELSGTIRELLRPATHADSVCGKCTDDRKDQPVVGMEILRHLHRDGDAWTGGEILDPQNGKTYRAKVKLDDDGKKLIVRGYLGISLFGRSQTWLKE